MGGMTSPLDDIIGMGDTMIGDHEDVGDLGYVIPPMGGNCGAGGNDQFNAVTVGMGPTAPDADDASADYNPGEGDIATDVARGYSELLGLFAKVYGAPGVATDTGTAGVLTAAQKALTDQIAAGNTTGLTAFENAVTTAQENHNKARAAFNDAAGGPIYQAGVAEWMAKSVVTKAIVDYDAAVVKSVAARTGLDELDYANYVPLGVDDLIDTVFTFPGGMISDPVLTELTDYANADLNDPHVAIVGVDDPNTEDIDETGVTTTVNSNFDAAGRLVVPMSLQDHDDDTETPNVLAPTKEDQVAERMVSDVRQVRTQTRQAAAALTKLAADNLNPALQTIYDEAARRAQAEADYYDGVYTAMLGDTTNQNDVTEDVSETVVDESAPFSIASRNSAFQTQDNTRFIAEQTLRGAVKAREDATAGVRAAFNSPHDFYAQLIARRQALKVAADRALAKASEDGATPSKTVTDNAAAAAKALVEAEEAQATVAAALGDEENPASALVAELLKTGGDDGQALVDAISAVYDTATSAVSDAEGIIDELRAPVAANTADIESLDGRVTVNEGAISTNADNIAGNATNILANRTDIDTNIANIATNTAGIATNAGHIMTNAGNISMNAEGITANSGRIDANEMGIAANMNSIGDNRGMIDANRGMISDLTEEMEVVRAGVAASMALAGMPAINGRGISIGVGSFDGESAFAVGFQIQGEMASFKVGLTSGGGATGASAGVGFQF